MVFTREDILKIQNALLQLGRKDSEFKDANTPLNSEDEIAILQDGINKKVSINNLLSTLGLLKKDDFINVSDRYDEYYIQLSEAITIIANNKRKKGLAITFQDLQGNWRIFQFNGELNNFINTDYWKDLEDFKYPIINSILPDEEDLTLTLPDINNNTYIKLKDKDYDAQNFSGKATKILRKNIKEVNGERKNILIQDNFNKENCIYYIKYDFDLNNQTITIPKNCILKFEGGTLKNGTIKGTDTLIQNSLETIFCNIILTGTFTNNEAYISWFYTDGTINWDSYQDLKNVLLIGHTAIINHSIYVHMIKDGVKQPYLGIREGHTLKGTNNSSIFYVTPDNVMSYSYSLIFCFSNVTVENLIFQDTNYRGEPVFDHDAFIGCGYLRENITIRNCKFLKMQSVIFKGIPRNFMVDSCVFNEGDCHIIFQGDFDDNIELNWTIQNCQFIKKLGIYSEGISAFMTGSGTGSNIKILNNIFINNSAAPLNGQTILIGRPDANVKFKNVTIENNIFDNWLGGEIRNIEYLYYNNNIDKFDVSISNSGRGRNYRNCKYVNIDNSQFLCYSANNILIDGSSFVTINNSRIYLYDSTGVTNCLNIINNSHNIALNNINILPIEGNQYNHSQAIISTMTLLVINNLIAPITVRVYAPEAPIIINSPNVISMAASNPDEQKYYLYTNKNGNQTTLPTLSYNVGQPVLYKNKLVFSRNKALPTLSVTFDCSEAKSSDIISLIVNYEYITDIAIYNGLDIFIFQSSVLDYSYSRNTVAKTLTLNISSNIFLKYKNLDTEAENFVTIAGEDIKVKIASYSFSFPSPTWVDGNNLQITDTYKSDCLYNNIAQTSGDRANKIAITLINQQCVQLIGSGDGGSKTNIFVTKKGVYYNDNKQSSFVAKKLNNIIYIQYDTSDSFYITAISNITLASGTLTSFTSIPEDAVDLPIYNTKGINIKYNESGTTKSRPSYPPEGFQYYDTTLHKPIWWNGTQWIDGTNTPV